MLKHMCRVRLLWAFFWILGLHPGLGMAAETITTEKLKNPEFSGSWVNDRGSVVHLFPSNGLVNGFYQTNLGQPDMSQRFPLTGFIQGDLITFTVNLQLQFDDNWAGQLSGSDGRSFTLWHLTRDIADEIEDANLWRSSPPRKQLSSPFQPVAP